MPSYLLNYVASLWATCATTLGIALFVILKGSRVPANRRFVIFNLAIAWWAFWQGLLPLSASVRMASWVQQLEHVAVVFISTFFLHFIYTLLELKRPFWLRFHYTISGLFLATIPTPWLLGPTDTTRPYLPYIISPGPLYPVMVAWFLVESAQGLWVLVIAYLKSTGAARNRMKYLAWGALIGYAGGCGNYLYVFRWELPVFNPFGTYGVPIYVAMTTYAIVRHRLMDITVVLKKTVIYTLLYSLCLAVFGFVVFFLGQWVVLGGIDPRLVGLSMLGLLIVVAMVRPLDRALTKLTDRLFFQERARYQQTLKAASAGMGRIRNLPKLLTLIARLIVNSVRIHHATIFLKSRTQSWFVVVASQGFLKKPVGLLRLEAENPLVTWFGEHQEPVVAEELKAALKRGGLGAETGGRDRMARVVAELERFQAAVCVPSFIDQQLKGILMLGEKRSGDMYTQEDLDIFATLAAQAALAVENAEAYEELRDTRDQLVQAERLATIGKFAADMAHEIKNPLQAIMTFFDFLPEKYGDPDFRERFAGIARAEAQRIDHLVRDLVTYAMPKSPQCHPVALDHVIESVLALLENDLHKGRVEVRRGYSPNGLTVEADRDQMKQVFLNLFMNALEAMPPAENASHVLDIAAFPAGETLVVKIRDTGAGIDPKHLPVLFAPFFTTKEKGSGLGLAIVQNIVRTHHGTIAVDSRLGVGTTVTLTLPRRQSAVVVSLLAQAS